MKKIALGMTNYVADKSKLYTRIDGSWDKSSTSIKLLPNIELRIQMIARTTLALMILVELK